MTVCVALLRAVNLGPHNKIGMPALCSFFADLEHAEPRSVVQSGNVVFRASGGSGAKLERTLETEAENGSAFEPTFSFVRPRSGRS